MFLAIAIAMTGIGIENWRDMMLWMLLLSPLFLRPLLAVRAADRAIRSGGAVVDSAQPGPYEVLALLLLALFAFPIIVIGSLPWVRNPLRVFGKDILLASLLLAAVALATLAVLRTRRACRMLEHFAQQDREVMRATLREFNGTARSAVRSNA